MKNKNVEIETQEVALIVNTLFKELDYRHKNGFKGQTQIKNLIKKLLEDLPDDMVLDEEKK